MSRLAIILILLVSSLGILSAQTDQEIIRFAFNGQWQEADSILDQRINNDPDNPKNYYLKQQILYYARYYSGPGINGDTLLQRVVENALKTIDLVENKEPSIDDMFYAGSANDYLSRYYIRQGSYWDAFWAARDARNYLEEALEQNPDYYDAYMSLAVREYFTATRLSGFYATLAWFVGMSGERDLALQYFHMVKDNGNLCQTEAKFALAAIYRFFESDFPQAMTITEDLLAQHPDNPFLQTQRDQLHFTRLIDQKGIAFLTSEFDSLQTKYRINNSATLNLLGYYYINQSRFEDAIAVFETNVKLFPGQANLYDSMAEGYWRAGQNEQAIEFYRKAYSMIDADTTITDQFKEFLRDNIENNLDELGGELNI